MRSVIMFYLAGTVRATSTALLVRRWNRFDQNNSWVTDRQTDRLTR